MSRNINMVSYFSYKQKNNIHGSIYHTELSKYMGLKTYQFLKQNALESGSNISDIFISLQQILIKLQIFAKLGMENRAARLFFISFIDKFGKKRAIGEKVHLHDFSQLVIPIIYICLFFPVLNQVSLSCKPLYRTCSGLQIEPNQFAPKNLNSGYFLW